MNRSSAASPEVRLADLGLVLPPPAAPVAAYVAARGAWAVSAADRLPGQPPASPLAATGLLFISGQIPMRDGRLVASGPVPSHATLEQAREAARQCTLNGLAAARAALGSLDRIEGVVRVGCFVACDPSFTDHPKVANGASELLEAIFGEAGRHARAAVGAPSLPLGATVEVEFLFLVRR